jgi:hypothetical protein
MSAYSRDNRGENVAIATGYEPFILQYIKDHPNCTMQDIYSIDGVGDTPMYLAIHSLVKKGLINGESPYESDNTNHTEYSYTAKE